MYGFIIAPRMEAFAGEAPRPARRLQRDRPLLLVGKIGSSKSRSDLLHDRDHAGDSGRRVRKNKSAAHIGASAPGTRTG